MILRALLVGVFFAGTGCPHPAPPVQPPTPVVFDGGVDVQDCGISVATQDKVTGKIVNAAMAEPAAGERQMTHLVAQYNLTIVRCVAIDVITDLRGAPKAEARIIGWLRANGGTP